MSDTKNFRVATVSGKSAMKCVLCREPATVIDINGRSLREVVDTAEAHTMVAHNEQHKSENAWAAATGSNNSDGPGPLDELSEAAERALRAAASEILPLVTKWFTKPR